ncbi:MAG: GNAT family N-acetyltransferase [Burkholderiales bacterium]|nr:GNAT family N-acetyltransferase [Burkholderiales bacterium]
MLIHTQRLRLISFQEEHLSSIVGDPRTLGELLRVKVPEKWPGHPQAYSHALALLRKQPLLQYSGWWLYMFVNTAIKALVGSGGFKSTPDADGVVEIGCETAPAFRRQGFAAEAMFGLISYAFTRPEVTAIDAYSMPMKCPQSELARAIGMKKVGEAVYSAVGKVWHWRMTRKAFLDMARRTP